MANILNLVNLANLANLRNVENVMNVANMMIVANVTNEENVTNIINNLINIPNVTTLQYGCELCFRLRHLIVCFSCAVVIIHHKAIRPGKSCKRWKWRLRTRTFCRKSRYFEDFLSQIFRLLNEDGGRRVEDREMRLDHGYLRKEDGERSI